jgi:hypothetical protein
MKVFISWSGIRSKQLGETLRDWLPGVLQLVKPYFTPSDTEKGTRWESEIAKELENSEIGILCVTRENIHSDWVMFEAGALSKVLDKSHVCPVLFGITNTDLAGPLKQFQTTEFSKSDFRKLITVINGHMGDNRLPPKTLDTVFDKWWPELEQQISGILSEDAPNEEPVRSERELLVEILELSRAASSRRVVERLSPKAISDLVDAFVELHDDQVARTGGYQATLDAMRGMSLPLLHLARRSGASSPAIERLDTLEYVATPVVEEQDFAGDDDIPF